MRVQDLAQLSTRMFKTNPLRTWLTILGMGVGTGAVVVLVGLGFGLQQIILEQIVFGDSLLSLGVTSTGVPGLTLTPETVTQFENQEAVVDAAPLASFSALITYKGLTGNVSVRAVEPEEVEDFIGERVSFRLLIPADDGTDNVNEILIDKEYVVRGITKEEGVLNAMMMLPELRNYVGIDEYERVQVNVVDNENLPIVEEWLIEQGYRVTALSKTVEQASQIFQGIQVVLAAFGGIALVVSAIGMFNTMTVTLLERTKEIGIMRTIGASPNDVKYLFVSESIVVGFLGGVTGILMGVMLGVSVNLLLNFVASQFGGQAVGLFSFPIDFLLFIATFSAAVGYLTGIFPARRASTLNPLDAIRYE
jgi:ABC-type antimicrobial peptide transport system permease subunit